MTTNDYKCLLHALRYNTWFTSIIASNKLEKEVVGFIAEVLQEDGTIEKLVLKDVGINRELAQQVSYSLNMHSKSRVKYLDISNNPVEVLQLFIDEIKDLYALYSAKWHL